MAAVFRVVSPEMGFDVFSAVRDVLGNALQLGERTAVLREDSGLLGVLPELDSMSVVTLIVALEERFDFSIEDDELEAEVFETLGSLVEFVETKTR